MKNCLTANNRTLITDTAVRKTDTQVQESLNEYTGRAAVFRTKELKKTKADITFQTAY